MQNAAHFPGISGFEDFRKKNQHWIECQQNYNTAMQETGENTPAAFGNTQGYKGDDINFSSNITGHPWVFLHVSNFQN